MLIYFKTYHSEKIHNNIVLLLVGSFYYYYFFMLLVGSFFRFSIEKMWEGKYLFSYEKENLTLLSKMLIKIILI